MAESRPFPLGLVAGIFLSVAGAIAAISALSIHVTTRQIVGPETAPLAVSLLLVVTGIILCVHALMGRWECEASGSPIGRLRPATLVWLLTGIISSLALIGPIGFTPASTILFGAITKALGARSFFRSLFFGLILSLTLELVFVHALGVDLGTGLLSITW
ncbi:tripartite tricarboxylate transporter TctB family protein [Agrobacterium vitis]|uniref:tripartite tricarboxylate transporter TctB family protein n=1 Tax=Agrobacterium vitis TaxID=373 RepID=UPI003D28BA89